jgi:hypothetical protein
MPDFYGNYVYGPVARPNWTSVTGVENLTSNMEFITVTTGVFIGSDFPDVAVPFNPAPGAYGFPTPGEPGPVAPTAVQVCGMNALNKLLEIIAERGQPIIMGNVVATGTATPSTQATPYAPVGTPTGAVYTLFLVTEHLGWSAVQGPPSSAPGVVPVVYPPPVLAGPRLVDRIYTDGVNFGFQVDPYLNVSIGSFLT